MISLFFNIKIISYLLRTIQCLHILQNTVHLTGNVALRHWLNFVYVFYFIDPMSVDAQNTFSYVLYKLKILY